MSEQNASPPPTGASAPTGPFPAMTMNVQYTKDLSFEVPGAPEIFSTLRAQPQINLNLDVQVRQLAPQPPTFEVTLSIRTEATEPRAAAAGAAGETAPAAAANGDGAGRTVFIAELAYCGIVSLNGVPEQQVEPMLLVEVPRLLFPFARNILADATRDGGFPPVLLQPIDFVALWQQRRAAAANQQVGHA